MAKPSLHQDAANGGRSPQSIEVADLGSVVSVKMQLKVLVRKEKPGLFESYCPALDLWSQGGTVAEAKKNIAEAVGLFIETCYEQGSLNRVLLDCGFSAEVKKQEKRRDTILDGWDKSFPVSAEIPLSAAPLMRSGNFLAAFA
ncbi:MAG: type II toxin-antitoxin system HicB family antitoxin [Gammaproteobacteria bacterium]